jgi:hypothetical protein
MIPRTVVAVMSDKVYMVSYLMLYFLKGIRSFQKPRMCIASLLNGDRSVGWGGGGGTHVGNSLQTAVDSLIQCAKFLLNH